MSVTILDMLEPLELRAGDLREADGLTRAMQRVMRLLFMRSGELLHRPTLGADLASYGNRPATPQNLQDCYNAAVRCLDALDDLDSYKVEIVVVAGAMYLNLTIVVNGASLTRRDVKI